MHQEAHFTSNFNCFHDLPLPESTHELIQLFQTATLHLRRICALAKIKQQILTALKQQPPVTPSPSVLQTVQQLFSDALLRFLKKNRPHTEQAKAEANLFFHVVSLAIKYYYSEEGFRALLGNVTDLIDRHSYRVLPALQFFTEIISTIQCSFTDQAQKTQRCRFQRHLTNEHINSMLTLANFCLERGVLPENTSLEDGHSEEHLKVIAPQETLTAAVRLIRVCLCFDWLGEKYNELEQVAQMSCLVIPTKRTRQTAESEYEKWLRSSEWIWVYQFIFKTAQSVALRVEVAGLVGDLARVHMKFFKNKANYRTHLENIVYCFSKMIDELEIYRNSQDTIQVALSLLFNLHKIFSGSANAIFFEINPNFWRGLLEILKKFIVYQIIGEEIFNANLIYYSFNFLGAVLRRSRFESNPGHFQAVEEVLRDVCRSYEQYLRILLNKIRKTPIRVSEASYYRLDYAQLRDSFNCYGWRQLQVYFIPFKLMKPRYGNANTIYQFFVYICARVCRAVSLLEMFKLEKWEKEVAYSMVSQSVAKLSEKFSFTSYKKIRLNLKDTSQQDQLCPLPPISEHYEEQIENEEEYCHMLRLNVFFIMDQLLTLSSQSAMKVSSSIVRLVSLGLELCFFADLQEEDSQQLKETIYQQKLEEAFEMFPLLLKKAFLREYQRALWQLGTSIRKITPIYVHFSFHDYEFVDLELQTEAADLLALLAKIHREGSTSPSLSPILDELRLLTLLCLDSQWPQIPEECLTSVETCLLFLEVMVSEEVLNSLIRCRHPRFLELLSKMVRMVDRVDYKQDKLPSILRLLRVVAELRASQASEEALNKIFVLMKCLLPFLSQTPLSSQLQQECSLLSKGVLSGSQEADLLQLGRELERLIENGKSRMEHEATCLPFSGRITQSVEGVLDVIIHDRSGEEGGQGLGFIDKKKESKAKNSSELEQKVSKAQDSEIEGAFNGFNNNQQLIYSGYHRSKTMSVLAKYMTQENQPQQDINTELDHVPPESFEDNKPLSEFDSKFPAEPMEIEHHHNHTTNAYLHQHQKETQSQAELRQQHNHFPCKNDDDLDEQTILQELQEDEVDQMNLPTMSPSEEGCLPMDNDLEEQEAANKPATIDFSAIQELKLSANKPKGGDIDGDNYPAKETIIWESPDPETNPEQPTVETESNQREEQDMASATKGKGEITNGEPISPSGPSTSPVELAWEKRNLLLVSSSSSEGRQSPQQ